MAIYYSGTFTRSAGLVSAIGKQVKLVNLKPVKKIEIEFDPFHENAKSVRDLLFYITGPKVTNTNPNCIIKTSVVSDRREPCVNISLIESGSVKLKAGYLTTLELLQLYNKHISSLVKAEVETDLKKVKKLSKKR